MGHKETAKRIGREKARQTAVGRFGSDYEKRLWDLAESKGMKLSIPEFWAFRLHADVMLGEFSEEDLNELKKLRHDDKIRPA